MGCGVSRPITDERTAPVSGGFHPIRRRIEEIKRRRGVHTITGSTPSKKELLEDRVGLEDEEEEAAAIEVEDDHESHTSPKSLIHDHIQKDNEDGVKSSAKELSSMPEKEKEGRMSQSDNMMKPPPPPAPAPILTSEEKRIEVVEKGGGGGGGGGVKGKEEENEEAEEEDRENDEEENGYGYIDGPGSPSFRDYYVPSIGNSMELTDTSKEEDTNEEVKKEKKSRRNESIASSEGSITQLVKKQSKVRRFRRVLPKGLKVKSCYTPPCTSSHDNSQQLLKAKVVHAS